MLRIPQTRVASESPSLSLESPKSRFFPFPNERQRSGEVTLPWVRVAEELLPEGPLMGNAPLLMALLHEAAGPVKGDIVEEDMCSEDVAAG